MLWEVINCLKDLNVLTISVSIVYDGRWAHGICHEADGLLVLRSDEAQCAGGSRVQHVVRGWCLGAECQECQVSSARCLVH